MGEIFQGFPGGRSLGKRSRGQVRSFVGRGGAKAPRSEQGEERGIKRTGLRGCKGLEPGTSGCGRVPCLGYGVPGKVDRKQGLEERAYEAAGVVGGHGEL